eukprot:4465317-Amphidinium_carterae.2
MAEVELAFAMEGFSQYDNKYRRVTGLNFEENATILGDKQGIGAVDWNTLFEISKSLTGKGRYNGVADGWMDIRTAVTGHSMRNVLLAMMQGEKPRYEIRIINNPSGSDHNDDLDIKILKYRMLQGHFSRMQDNKEATGTDPKAVSTLLKVEAELPGDTGPKMRYGYHASALSVNAYESIVAKGIVPGGQADRDWVIRDSVHLCPLHPTHNDAVGIWGFNRPVKDRNSYDGPTTQAIFVVDLLMLQEEYEVGIYQARSGKYLIPSVIPWNCVSNVINMRGTNVDIWNVKVKYGLMDASLDAQRLLSERQKKRTRTTDPDFKEKRQEMDREEFANMLSSSASTQQPKGPPPPPPPPKGPPADPTAKFPPPPAPKMKPPPPTPKGAPGSSSPSGVQFGNPPAPPKPPPPPHRVRGAFETRHRPLGEMMGTTWSGCYGEMFSDSTDVIQDFEKAMPQRASRLSIFSNQDFYNTPEVHPSTKLWPRKQNNTKNCFAITSSFDWKQKGPTIKEAQKNLYLSLDGPLIVTLESGEVYQVPAIGTPERLSGYVGPTMEAFDLARSFDYLLGHMLDHECELLDVVKKRLEKTIANLSNAQLLNEGAAWFGWYTGRWESPIHFVPHTLFNDPRYQYVNTTSEELSFADERREVVMEEYSAKTLTAKQMRYYLGLYGITEKNRRAKAQHLGAWALDCMWAEVRARINRVDAVATKKLIQDNKLEAVLNKEYAKLRPQEPLYGVGDDEDFGNIFEAAGTISILMRNLRIIRRILIAVIGTLSPAEAEKFWKWEPGFGYQYNGKITSEAQTISFRAVIASSPMEMTTPRESNGSTPSGDDEGVRNSLDQTELRAPEVLTDRSHQSHSEVTRDRDLARQKGHLDRCRAQECQHSTDQTLLEDRGQQDGADKERQINNRKVGMTNSVETLWTTLIRSRPRRPSRT